MIVDLMMPGLSGMDLLKMLKARNPEARIIMVTGYPTMRNTLQAMQLGAMDFLPKPFLPTTLRNLVAAGPGRPGTRTPEGIRRRGLRLRAARPPISAGLTATRTPAARRASIFSWAVPLPPAMIAPA